MAKSLTELTKELAQETKKNAEETKELYQQNVKLRSTVADLSTVVGKSEKAEKRVQFLENLLDKNQVGLAETFADTLKGPLNALVDAIPGKQFLLPFFKLAVQKTPLKGVVEKFRDRSRDKLETAKATAAIESSGMQFGSEEEKQAAIERVKVEMQRTKQEEGLKEKNAEIAKLLGIQQDKFHEIIGNQEELDRQQEAQNKQMEDMMKEKPSSSSKPKKEKPVKNDTAIANIPGAAADTSGTAAEVEVSRKEGAAAERRHRELLEALKGKDGKGEGSIKDSGDGKIGGIGGVIKSIGQGFKYLGKNLASIAKGALAMALMGASLIPFAISAKQFSDVEWESMAKAGVALVGLAGVAFLLGKASGSMIIGAAAIVVLSGALYVAGKAFQQFAELDWKTVGLGLAAIAGLGAIAALLSFASPLIITGSIAIGALGIALIPFAYAAQLAAPALTEIANAMGMFADVPISTMFAIPAALVAIGAGLVAMSGGGLLGSVADGIGGLFGADSPVEKLVKIAEAAPEIIKMGAAMESFGDNVDSMMDGLDRIDSGKVDKLEMLGDKIEDFVDKMPGPIGQLKLAAFAASFASIAASAGVAPAVAQGVADATGEVIEVQQKPQAFVAKAQGTTPDMEGGVADGIDAAGEMQDTVVTKSNDESVPPGKVKIRYKGKIHIVDQEDAEKVQAINNKLEELGKTSQELNQQYEDAGPYARVQKRRIKDANRRVVAQSVKLENEKSKILESITGADSQTPNIQPTSAGDSGQKMTAAQSEYNQTMAEQQGTGGSPVVVNAPTTTNVTQGGGGGGMVMPVPLGEPDRKTAMLIAGAF